MSDYKSNYISNSQKEELSSRIKNDLNAYFNFVELLNKERPAKLARQIEEYIKQQPNILQRIAFIEELDRDNQFSHRKEIHLIDEEVKGIKDKIVQKKESRRDIHKTPFLSFLFYTRKAIIQFGSRTRILASRFLSLRLTGESEHHYKLLLGNVNSVLLKATNHMVDNGWKLLDRRAYNLVVQFLNFLKGFSQAGNIFNRNDNKYMIRQLEFFISSYLICIQKKIYKDVLKESFYEILYFSSTFKPMFRDIIDTLNHFLDTDSRGMCYYNILTSIYMIQYKHFIKQPELLYQYNIQDIDESKYNFSPKIRKVIDDQLETLKGKHLDAEDKLYYLRFLDEDFNFNSDLDNPVLQLFGKLVYFEQLVESNSFSDLIKSGQIDINKILMDIQENMTPGLIRYLKGFLNVYTSFLCGEVHLKNADGSGVVQEEIFKEWIFSKDILMLKTLQSDLELLQKSTSYFTLSFNTYQNYILKNKVESEKEEKICSKIRGVVDIFYSMSEKITNVLYRNYEAQCLNEKEKLKLSSTQTESVSDLINEPRFLPHAMKLIDQDQYLTGQTVLKVMQKIAIFTVNFSNIFHNPSMTRRQNEKQKLISISEEYLNLKSKLQE